MISITVMLKRYKILLLLVWNCFSWKYFYSFSIVGTQTEVTPESVLQAVLRGIKKGEESCEIKVRIILCCFRGKTGNH